MPRHEFKKMNKELLQSSLESCQQELAKLNLQRSTGAKLENPGNVSKLRRNIARIHTELRFKANKQQGGTSQNK
ncbi:MAG TPA: 50S ribosomal protein L29 [Candidatus Nanoarchaeia archaeon]|nr:50S ribosomal protein L29 [Candidatus Nanoarchaeia archaeon]